MNPTPRRGPKRPSKGAVIGGSLWCLTVGLLAANAVALALFAATFLGFANAL